MLKQGYARGEMTRSEHRLLSAFFELDGMVSGRIMVPRGDVLPTISGVEVIRQE